MLYFFLTVLYDKNKEISAQTLVHRVKQRNEMGVVGKYYTVDVLTLYRTYLPKIINHKCQNCCKKSTGLFCGYSVVLVIY